MRIHNYLRFRAQFKYVCAIGAVTTMMLGAVAVTSVNPAEARPSYGQDIGLQPGNCTFCHVGPQGNKRFTNDGYLYAQGLVRKNLLTQSVMNTLVNVDAAPARPACKQQTIVLYDMNGNFQRNHTHCVP